MCPHRRKHSSPPSLRFSHSSWQHELHNLFRCLSSSKIRNKIFLGCDEALFPSWGSYSVSVGRRSAIPWSSHWSDSILNHIDLLCQCSQFVLFFDLNAQSISITFMSPVNTCKMLLHIWGQPCSCPTRLAAPPHRLQSRELSAYQNCTERAFSIFHQVLLRICRKWHHLIRTSIHLQRAFSFRLSSFDLVTHQRRHHISFLHIFKKSWSPVHTRPCPSPPKYRQRCRQRLWLST